MLADKRRGHEPRLVPLPIVTAVQQFTRPSRLDLKVHIYDNPFRIIQFQYRPPFLGTIPFLPFPGCRLVRTESTRLPLPKFS